MFQIFFSDHIFRIKSMKFGLKLLFAHLFYVEFVCVEI